MNSGDSINSIKFGVVSYSYNNGERDERYYNPREMNIGDYIQSLAARQFLPRVDAFVDRDRLALYSGEKVKMIMNAWYRIWEENRVFSEAIDPLMVSIHLDNVDELEDETIVYFKRHEPIGCRDLNTMRGLQEKGVRAYFSGCMTLTLGKTYQAKPEERENKILFVDHQLGSEVRIARSVADILKRYKNCKYESLKKFYPIGSDPESCLQEAEDVIREYARAQLVITENIHCALPCLAIGTPVIFVTPKFDSKRFQGIWDFFNAIGYGPSGSFEERIIFDDDGKVVNPSTHVPYAETLKEKCTAFIGEESCFSGLNNGPSALRRPAESMPSDCYGIIIDCLNAKLSQTVKRLDEAKEREGALKAKLAQAYQWLNELKLVNSELKDKLKQAWKWLDEAKARETALKAKLNQAWTWLDELKAREGSRENS